MTREQVQALYRAGEETVVRALGELSREMDQLKADFAVLKAENLALRVPLPSTINALYRPLNRCPNTWCRRLRRQLTPRRQEAKAQIGG
ncbi:MAG: hypothetical protein L0Z50_07130, partial [Verrucomicrobiales bacterium]|nr:hypothetical protein [Verrucomicrobiales bacterium]